MNSLARSYKCVSAGFYTVGLDCVDGSFHSPEWHAARLASLNTSHTIIWEEYKKKQKLLFVISYSSSSDEEERGSRKSKSRSKRSKKEKKSKSRSKDTGLDNEGDGPVRLSRFFGSVKSQ
ncbi:hypothetical protein VNO78_11922 [Psophocarpus tetragonolobus]|uniref:Uncharacterized protein n=1 Tax=Psophocarpus tetragonolobus TaxID=3891 RepID=A0AAN9SM77_PSOTE